VTDLAPPPHRCPGPACAEQVPIDKLACSRHWFQVPRAVRGAVYAAWDHGAGAGSPEHRAAMRAALAWMKPL
jgi:hypothetical protein